MQPGEFAVLFTNTQPASIDPSLGFVAVLFSSLEKAVAYARAEVKAEPRLRCSIYDVRGLSEPPLRIIAGAKGQDRSFLSSKFRLWMGSICLVVGIALGAAELMSDMSLSWAGMLGARVGPVGVILLLTEIGVRLSERRKKPLR